MNTLKSMGNKFSKHVICAQYGEFPGYKFKNQFPVPNHRHHFSLSRQIPEKSNPPLGTDFKTSFLCPIAGTTSPSAGRSPKRIFRLWAQT